MLKLLHELLPMVFALAISQFIYLKIDKNHNITNKVNLKLKLSQEWKNFFLFSLALAIMMLIFLIKIALIKIFKIEISNTFIYTLNGCIIGIFAPMANKSNLNKSL